MQEIQTILIAGSLIFIWMSFRLINGDTFIATVTDFKPLNCAFCLSVLAGVALSIWHFDLIYISLPLIYNFLKS